MRPFKLILYYNFLNPKNVYFIIAKVQARININGIAGKALKYINIETKPIIIPQTLELNSLTLSK